MPTNLILLSGNLEIYCYSIYPNLKGNNFNKMVAELTLKNRSDNPTIKISDTVTSSDIRDMAKRLIEIADTIDKFNEQIESDG
jgi:hypothetical protein